MNNSLIRILSLHWGFIPGGVAQYASYIENVGRYAPIRIKSICVNSNKWAIDRAAASDMDMDFIQISSRLDFSWLWKIREVIKKLRPQLIFTHGFNGYFVAAISKIGLDVPISSSWHGVYYGTSLIQKIVAPIINQGTIFLLKHCVKNIVTVSEFSKKTLEGLSVNSIKIKRIYNGISSFDSIRSLPNKNYGEINYNNSELQVGTVCRLDSTKDLPTLLQAIRIVRDKSDRIKFTIWGDGPERNMLTKLARTLEIQNSVRFAGYESNIDICLKTLDIFVLSSKIENFSIGLLEAMRAGLPIIATSVGGNPEAVEHMKHAILVSSGNPGALAQEILLFGNSRDLRKKFGAAAQMRFYENFTSEKMVCETAKWLVHCATGVNYY